MADLPNRDKYEQQLAKQVAAILARNREELANPAIDQPETERSLYALFLALLGLVFIAGSRTAAKELGIGVAADAAAGGWTETYVPWLSRRAMMRVRKTVELAKRADPLNAEGLVDKALDVVTSEKAWVNWGATEIARANTAGGEHTAREFNKGRLNRQRAIPTIGMDPIVTVPGAGELVPAEVPEPEQQPTEPPDTGIPEPALAIWHTSGDDRVCPVCRPLHGRPREDWERVLPLGPPAHPVCRCWIDYEVA